MPDQANDLRQLVRQCGAPIAPAAGDRPRWIVVAGGKGGVGTTTIAVNLAVAISKRGLRAVLVDAAPGGDATILCRLEPRYTLADVLSGTQTAQNALATGPSNVRVLPGIRELERLSDYCLASMDRTLAQLMDLSPAADVVVLDAGNRPSRTAQRLWRVADALVLVTTAEPTAIMDTYAAVKLQVARDHGPSGHLLVNRSPGQETAEDVFRRLDQVCRRFLATRLASAGQVPMDDQVPAAATGGPFVVASPSCAAARSLNRVAQVVVTAAGARVPNAA
jgi:flagellar biosynthesis protein FlhG